MKTIIRPYKIGKKVGVFTFDLNRNKDIITEGVIVARKRDCAEMGNNYLYVVKTKDTYFIARQNEIWIKHKWNLK